VNQVDQQLQAHAKSSMALPVNTPKLNSLQASGCGCYYSFIEKPLLAASRKTFLPPPPKTDLL